MQQVDFYILNEANPANTLDFACKMTEKIYRKGLRVYIHTNSEQEAQKIDTRLWSFRQGSFVPHGICRPDEISEDPIIIGFDAESADNAHDGPLKNEITTNRPILINLADKIPGFFNQFDRITEIVDKKQATSKNSARDRYRFYKDHGCPLNSHELSG